MKNNITQIQRVDVGDIVINISSQLEWIIIDKNIKNEYLTLIRRIKETNPSENPEVCFTMLSLRFSDFKPESWKVKWWR